MYHQRKAWLRIHCFYLYCRRKAEPLPLMQVERYAEVQRRYLHSYNPLRLYLIEE
jgi:hypothetical protein